MAKKKGKPCRLYHLASMAVDTFRHVITHIRADFADEKDSRHLISLVEETKSRLKEFDTNMHKALADAAFSSGSNYAALEAAHIEGYVALYGQYHKQREGFSYDATRDVYICSQGKALENKGIKSNTGYFNYFYRSSASDCNTCPIKKKCCGKASRKALAFTAFRNHFDRMKERVESPLGRKMKRLRMSTVEPVFGSLLNYFGLKRINVKGKRAAHKSMLMSAAAYNLKKYLHFLKPGKAGVQRLALRKSMPHFCLLWLDKIWMMIKLILRIQYVKYHSHLLE